MTTSLEDRIIPGVGKPDRVVRTVCSPNCTGCCGINTFVKDDRIVKVEPASFVEPGYERICIKGIAMAMERLHHPDRLTHPLIRAGERGGGEWRRVSWDEAYDYIAERLTANAERFGPESNAFVTMSGNYGFKALTVAQRAANCLGGTILSEAGLTSDLGGVMGALMTMGGAGSNEHRDLKHAKYLLFVGRNIADTNHSEMHFLLEALHAGAKLVAVDPRFSRTAAKADEWVSIEPGTDVAMVLGMLNVIVREELFKPDYVRAHTNLPFLVRDDDGAMLREKDIVAGGSWDLLVWDEATQRPMSAAQAVRPALRGSFTIDTADGGEIACRTAFDRSWDVWSEFTPQHASSICGVPAEQIERVARDYATADPAWLHVSTGNQRYGNGHTAWRAWITLAALCGNIGKQYAGFNSDEGLLTSVLTKPLDAWVAPGGKRGRHHRGTKMMDLIVSEQPYAIKSLWTTCYGFATQSPFFKRFLAEGLPRLDLFVVSEQMMTPAAEYADVVLPVVSYYEDDWDWVAGFQHYFVQLRRRTVPPIGESRNDYDIFAGLFERMGKGEDWRHDPEQLCEYTLKNHPDPLISAVDWETLKREGNAMVPLMRPHIPFRDMKFMTSSGRIELYQEQFRAFGEEALAWKEPLESRRTDIGRKFPFSLITYKHVHSTHSTHLMLPMITDQLGRPGLEVNPADAAPRGIATGDLVEVFNKRGSFRIHVQVVDSVRPGTIAMPQGWWQRAFVHGHPSDLGHIPANALQDAIIETNYPAYDVAADIIRVGDNAA